MFKNKKLRLFLLLSLIFLPFFLFAKERKLEIEYPEIFGLKPETINTALEEYIKYIFVFSVSILGLIILIGLIWGGFLYLTSTVQPAKRKEAKDKILSAFLGAILLLCGYIILTTINPHLKDITLPFLEKTKSCEENRDCPRGFICNQEKGNCEMVSSCTRDEECPYTYKCIEGKCKKEKEKITQVFWEIPLGQMMEKGLWEKERSERFNRLIDEFEIFLNQQLLTTEDGKKINRISDLNRYLKTLTEDCHCEDLDGICQKPKNFSFPVGCMGDPCKKTRDKINNVLKINERVSKEIIAYKKKFDEFNFVFSEEGRKIRNLTEEILEKCKKKGLLTRTEYYDSVETIEEQGGETKLERLYLPTKDDPLVFYCAVGGTIYDEPYAPEQTSFEELEKASSKFELEPPDLAGEPLSCPVVIPVGRLILDQISALSYENNYNLDKLVYYIEEILKALNIMTELISQCNESRCNVSCSCVPNPCFEPACGIPPTRENKCGIGKCTPPTPVTPNPCYFFCDSPCLQAVGSCHGEPCPRQKIIETVELIKIYEDEILGKEGQGGILEGLREGIESAHFMLKNKDEKQVDLETIRAGIQHCLRLGAQTSKASLKEEPKEEKFWMLLRCGMAIGNKGPDNNIIKSCHPQDFYCCSTRPVSAQEIKDFPEELRREKLPVYVPPAEEIVSPSEFGFNNVPYFSQYDERWRNVFFGCGKTIGQAGCGPTSIAMVLSYFGKKTDPPLVADWILKNNYRVCGAGTAHSACCKAVEYFDNEKDLKCQNFHGNIRDILTEIKDGEDTVAIVSGKGDPPYTKGGHYIVLTGIVEEWGKEFVYYNDPAYDPLRPYKKSYARRTAKGREPADFFIRNGIGAGCVISKK